MRNPLILCFVPLLLSTYIASESVLTQECDIPCSNTTCSPPYLGTCCHKKNIALGSQHTSQSSEFMEHNRYLLSDLAVDGNTNTDFTSNTCTHTDDEDETDAWWMINLESTYNISEIMLYLRSNNAQRYNGLKVLVNSTECFRLNKTFSDGDTPPEDQIQHIHCSPPISGSVVRVTVDIGMLTLCEVQIFLCDPGWYGEECDRQCNCRNSTDCDKRTGWCRDGCRAGKQGEGCQCDCQNGTYGLDCRESCGHCLEGIVCDKTNGTCHSGCVQGYTSPLCQECDEFYHKSGDICEKCGLCEDNKPCNITSGKCAGNCQAGYKPPLCKKECDEGQFGINCLSKCGNCSGNQSCNKTDGTCQNGCEEHFLEPMCTDCVPGWYGKDCKSFCGQCADNVNCSRDGTCPHGCLAGFTGGLCQTLVEDDIVLIAGGVSAVILMVIIIVVVVFVIIRRRRAHVKSKTRGATRVESQNDTSFINISDVSINNSNDPGYNSYRNGVRAEPLETEITDENSNEPGHYDDENGVRGETVETTITYENFNEPGHNIDENGVRGETVETACGIMTTTVVSSMSEMSSNKSSPSINTSNMPGVYTDVTGVRGDTVNTTNVAGIVKGGMGNTIFNSSMSEMSSNKFSPSINTSNMPGVYTDVTGVRGDTVNTTNVAGIVKGGMGNTIFNISSSKTDSIMKTTVSHIEEWNEGMVRTAALKEVLDKLQNGTRWLTIKGNPGEGKTTVGYMALEEMYKSGRRVFEVRTPEEFNEVISSSQRPVIMLDDVFGNLEFDQVKWSKWEPVLSPLLKATEHKSHRGWKEAPEKYSTIILIGRSYVLNSVTVDLGRLSDVLTLKRHVVLMDHSMERDIDEKRAIWTYMSNSTGVVLDPMTIENIIRIDVPHGFPLVCRLFTKIIKDIHVEENVNIAEEFFMKPLEFLNESISKLLEDTNKEVLFQEMLKGDGNACSQQLRKYKVLKTARDLVGSYLKIKDDVFSFDHPSIYDSVAYLMCLLDPVFVINHCHLSFIYERVRLQSYANYLLKPRDESSLIANVPNFYADDLAERFAAEIMSNNFLHVLPHQAFTEETFVCKVMDKIQTPLTRILHLADSDHSSLIYDNTFLSLVPSSKSPELLKYLDNCSDIKLDEEDEKIVLYGTCKYAAYQVLLYLQESRKTLNINVRFHRYFKWTNQTPLMVSAKSKDCHFVHQLLSFKPDPNARDDGGRTALHYLCANGLVSVVAELTDSGADIDVQDNDRESPLCYACAYSHLEVVKLLIERGAKVNEKTLFSACRGGNRSILEFLFEKNKDLDTIGIMTYGLSGASQGGNIDIMNVLVDKGASVNAPGSYLPPLHAASMFHRLHAVRWLLQRGSDIDSCDVTGNTALHRAAEFGSDECVEVLLRKGATMDKQNDEGNTALLIAAELAYKEYVDMLLRAGAIQRIQNNKGDTALHKASERGSEGCVKLLLKKDAAVNMQNSEGDTALHKASERGSEGCVDMLLKTDAAVNIQNNKGDTALHKASERGSEGCVDMLLKTDAAVNIQNSEGDTALHKASERGSEGCVDMLLKKDAAVNIQNNKGDTALHKAAERGSEGCVDMLPKEEATVDVQDKNGNTAVHKALERGSEGCVDMLLKKDAAVNIQNNKGDTALHKAAERGSEGCVDMLLKEEATVDVQDKNGNTALHVAAMKGSVRCVQLLLNKGAKVDIQNKEGEMPLHKASRSGSKECIVLLLKAGAPVDAQNKQGSTALRISSEKRFQHCVEVLLEAGATVDLHQAAYRGSKERVDALLKAGDPVDMQNNKGDTALHMAATSASKDCVDLLLKAGAGVNIQNKEGDTALHLTAKAALKTSVGWDMHYEGGTICTRCDKENCVHEYHRRSKAVSHLLIEHGAEVNIKKKAGDSYKTINQSQ